jgi:hypothetical protein
VYVGMAKHMAKWTEAGMVKEAASTTALRWLRAACSTLAPSPTLSTVSWILA